MTREAREIARWIDAGAAVMVCGSVTGMAPAVHDSLSRALGDDAFDCLIESGRYRRDIY